jgi:ElaB/YqjD/DUF883 family membrane-anchored ribosome-binding protein
MDNKFRKGVILGGLLATAALVGITITRKKTVLDKDLQADLKNLVKTVKKNLADMEDITRDKYNEIVEKAVAEYSKKRKMAKEAQMNLMEALQEKWDEMEEESSATDKSK